MTGLEDTAVGFALGFGIAFALVESNRQQVKRAWFWRRDKETAFERQVELWNHIKQFQFLLSEEDRALFRALKIRLDAGLELHPNHESRLREMREQIDDSLAW